LEYAARIPVVLPVTYDSGGDIDTSARVLFGCIIVADKSAVAFESDIIVKSAVVVNVATIVSIVAINRGIAIRCLTGDFLLSRRKSGYQRAGGTHLLHRAHSAHLHLARLEKGARLHLLYRCSDRYHLHLLYRWTGGFHIQKQILHFLCGFHLREDFPRCEG
jgi:hypothetical protein